MHLKSASGVIIAGVRASYSIGEVARSTGVTVETLRYYEKQGLLPRLARSAGGARRLGDDVVSRVHFIKQAQSVGLTLRDIRDLVGGGTRDGARQCKRTRDVLAARITELDQRLASMRNFRDLLVRHLDACDRALPTLPEQGTCPTVEALEHGLQPAVVPAR